ncbi:uncharacterized protein LOC135839405 [Planococcus citri]|uniref:uncharacterized protein LOC135839405 n=1 Tax=Planococcus citri TaxID=170843 RepID=UPI0031F8E541
MFFFENLVFLCFVIPSFSKSTSTQNKIEISEWTPHQTLPLPGLELNWEAMRGPLNKTLYVDKSRFVQYLGKSKLTFLTRPRRFGKTTFLQMVKNLYQDNRTLFEDLYVYQYGNVEWIRHRLRNDKQFIKDKWLEFPVIHLDFSQNMRFTTFEKYLEGVHKMLRREAERYNVYYNPEEITLTDLIERLEMKFELPVILLIDEYDSPYHRAKFRLENEQLADNVISDYEGFYTEIKSNVGKLAFALVTGVSCLAIQSLHSGPNSFNDYTYSKEMATAFGLTRTEIESNFGYHIYEFAKWRASQRVQGPKKEREPNPEDITLIYDELINWYDGYQFDIYCESETVLNVVSTITALETKVIGNHWSETGSMLPIIKQFYQHHRSLKDYEKGKRMSKGDVVKRVSPKMTKLPTNKMLLSYGYMAIKEFDKTKLNNEVFLEFANNEIKDAIETHLADFDLGTQDFISELPAEGTDLQDCFNRRVNIKYAMRLLNVFEFESYNYYEGRDGTLNTDEMPRRLQRVFKHYEITTERDVKFFKEDLSGPAGDIDLLTTNLKINVAAEIKCTQEKTSVAAINQLIGYYENHRTPFMQALGNPEEISFLGLHYVIVGDKNDPDLILKDWIYLPYYDGKLQIEDMQFSSSSDQQIFFNAREKKSTYTLVDDSRSLDFHPFCIGVQN